MKRDGYCVYCFHPRPCECDLRQAVREVLAINPEDHATTSRDYGRGFAEAIRLVREALS